MTDFHRFRDELLANDPEMRREYERLAPLYGVVTDAIKFRHAQGLSQDEVAKKMGKQQPAIARFEAARVMPSLQFLQDLAEALDLKLVVRLEPKEQPAKHKSKVAIADRITETA